MRVLWVYDYLSVQLQRLAASLAQHPDISLEILCRWGSERPQVPASIPVTPLACRSKYDSAARQAIREKIQSGGFDMVHAYTSRNLANVVGACRGLRPMPKIIGYRGTINRLQLLDPANWVTFWHPRVAHITCVCEATRRSLLSSGISDSKLSVVWEGCDAEGLLPPPSCARASFDLPDDAFVVGQVANMRRCKGLDLVLKAALQLADLPDVYFLLIGEPRDAEVRKLAADPRIADRVRLPGMRPEGGRFAGLFDVLASPSRMEGLSMSIMEAMSKRICPVVSNVGGNTELIRNEIDGLVVPTEDVAALARAIRRLHDEPEFRQRLAASAQQRAAELFCTARWAARLADTYRSLAGTAAAARAA